jgi:hypothetical protein
MIKKVLTLTGLVAGLLYACGPSAPVVPTIDINAIHTFAAETVIVEFTQTAQAASLTSAATATVAASSTPAGTTTPTTTTVPTNNPFETQPTQVLCDDADLDLATVDVTVPDGTQMSPGQDFVKTWKIRNSGSCTWGSGYTPIFAFGEKMSGIAEPLTGATAPGEEVEISVRFKAPTDTGEFTSTWRMANASNVPFGKNFFVKIVVR